jgi:hypothetical protein
LAGAGALGIGAAEVVPLAWARAVTLNPDARRQTNVNERFMRSTTPSLLLIEIARAIAEAYFASWSISCALLENFSDRKGRKRGEETRTEDILRNTQIIGGRQAQVNAGWSSESAGQQGTVNIVVLLTAP